MISRCGEGRNVQCIDLWPLSSSSKILVRRTYLDFFDDFLFLFFLLVFFSTTMFSSRHSRYSLRKWRHDSLRTKTKTWFAENENKKMLIDKISSYLNENSPFHFTFVKWFASQFCHYRSTFVHLNFFAVAYFFQLFHPPHLFFQLSTCVAMSYIHQSNSEFLSFSGGFCFFFLFLALFFHAFKKVWFAVKWNSCHSDTETVSRLIRLVSFWNQHLFVRRAVEFLWFKTKFWFQLSAHKQKHKIFIFRRKKNVENFCLSHPFSFIFIFADSWCYYFFSFYAWRLDCQYIYTHCVSLSFDQLLNMMNDNNVLLKEKKTQPKKMPSNEFIGAILFVRLVFHGVFFVSTLTKVDMQHNYYFLKTLIFFVKFHPTP